jgi:hypothetical protein
VATIRRAIESLLAQDDPSVDIVVQDGASTDGTLGVLREYGSAIDLVSEPDNGAGDALFRALRRARGDVIGSCMSDETLVPDAASWARRTLGAYPELGAAYGTALTVDPTGAPLGVYDAGEFDLTAVLTYRQLPAFVTTFFRAAALQQIGLWEYTGGGEVDLWLRLTVRYPVKRFPKTLATYGLSRDTLSNDEATYEGERGPRLDALRRLFADDQAGRRFAPLAGQAYAGYHLRYAGTFLRNGRREPALECLDRAWDAWPEGRPRWLPAPSLPRPARGEVAAHLARPNATTLEACLQSLAPGLVAHRERAWLEFLLRGRASLGPALQQAGIARVVVLGAEGFGRALRTNLVTGGVGVEAFLENNQSVREQVRVGVPMFSTADLLAGALGTTPVLSAIVGEHDRVVLPAIQEALGSWPVLSWKMFFEPNTYFDGPATVERSSPPAVTP